MPIIKKQYADHHEWIDTDNANKLQSPDFWTPAYEHYSAKVKIWCRDGMQHREYDYPAFVVEGIRSDWCIRGHRYRLLENGPAVVYHEVTDENDPAYLPPEYWLWDRMCDKNGVIFPDWEQYSPPEWVSWEGYLSDAELGYETTLPEWIPPEPTDAE